MMYQRGFSSLIVVLIATLILVSGSIAVLYFQGNNKTPIDPQGQIESKIDDAVANKMRSLGSDSGFDAYNTFKITNINGNYARGEVTIDGVIQNVHLISVNGEDWIVVEISEDPISCEKAAKMGYPSSMVSDCLYQHPAAEEVAVILAWSKDELIQAGEIQIIGEVDLGDDPSSSTFEIISEDGESIVITYDPNSEVAEDLSNGDYVVVDVSVSEGDDGEVVLDLESIEEVETVEDVAAEATETATDDESAEEEDGGETDSIVDLEPDINVDEEVTSDVIDDSAQDSDSGDSNDSSNDGIPIVSDDITENEPINEEFDFDEVTPETDAYSEEYLQSLIDRNNNGLRILSDF